MKKIELEFPESLVELKPYTYNSFNDDIRDFDMYADYLNNNFKNLDFTKVDKFYDYLCSIIDNMDYLFVEELENTKELDLYLNNLNYVYYDEIKINNSYWNSFCTHYLFNIKSVKAKKFVKDNIKFNLSDEDRETFIVETDRKYILNKNLSDENFCCNYGFVKDNFLQLILYQQDGYIYDYRDIDELTFLKIKNLKVENKDYNTYDYKLFSNDINDDKYINYIYDIVDDANYIFIYRLSPKEEKEYKGNLNYTYYDKVLLGDRSKDFKVNYIFDIKDKEAKEFIKNDIKFNLSDKDRNPIIVDTNKKYILNEITYEDYCYVNYGFIKDNTLLAVLHQQDGYLDDYRELGKTKLLSPKK